MDIYKSASMAYALLVDLLATTGYDRVRSVIASSAPADEKGIVMDA